MPPIASLNNIRTGQKVHLSSISKRVRSKYLTLFMLDNERQLLEKDNQILQQRLNSNIERIKTINKEIKKALDKDLKTSLEHVKSSKDLIKSKEWRTYKIDI